MNCICILETLRKWPPVAAIDRECIKPYKISDEIGRTHVINKGDAIMIPVFGLHRDPELFPNPDNFNPERFSEANKNLIRPFTYLPFGLGPRNCIGK